jgi:hypothetical protein
MQIICDDKTAASFYSAKSHVENQKRKAMLQFIMRRRVRCWQVFSWPVMYTMVAVGMFLFQEGVLGGKEHTASPIVLAAAMAFFLLIGLWIAIQEAGKRATLTMLVLEKIPEEEWLFITGVDRCNLYAPLPIVVSVGDPFSNVTKVTLGSLQEDWKQEEEDILDAYVVTCLRPKWEALLSKMTPRNNT